MTPTLRFILYLAVMVAVTYLLRLLPMLFIRKPIQNRFIRSVIYYVPYAVLAVMAFPAMLHVTPNVITGVVATAVTLTAAFFKRNLVTVSAIAASAILVMELLVLPLLA